MNVQNQGRLYYIDPNRQQSNKNSTDIQQPYEDLCISVDLEIIDGDRYMCGDPNEQVNKTVYSSTNGTISFMGGTSGSLTTNYTDVSLTNPNGNTSECLGIESISISYEPWMYPIVNIKFVDVRGGSLIGFSEHNLNKGGDLESNRSLFKSLFRFAYPLFKLKVKGFYGQKVTYNLCVQNFNAEFNCQTGNFEMTVMFKGYMYGVYTDIPMTYLAIAPYIGANNENINSYNNYWKTKKDCGEFVYIDGKDSRGTKMYTYPELREKLLKAKHIDSELSKTKEARELDELKTTEEKYKEAYSIFPFKNDVNDKWEIYDDSETSKCYYYYVKPNVVNLEDRNLYVYYDKEIYVSGLTVEDMYKFPKEEYESFKKIVTEDTYLKSKFSDIIKNFDKLEKKAEKRDNWTAIDYLSNKNSSKWVFTMSGAKTVDGQNISLKKNAVFIKKGSSRYDYYDKIIKSYLDSSLVTNVNIYEIETNTDIDFLNEEILDYFTNKKAELEKALKEQERILTADSLGFVPTIENMYRMSFAHMNTFIDAYYDVLHNIKRSGRTFKGLDINKNETDCVVNNGIDFIPPYPKFIKKKTEDGQTKLEEVWVGDAIGEDKANQLEEVQLVNKIIDASNFYAEEVEATEEATKYQGLDSYVPILPYEFAQDYVENPYEVFKNYENGTDILEQFMFILALRTANFMYYNGFMYYNSGNDIGFNLKNYGAIEAYNFYKAVPTLTPTIYTYLIQKGNKENFKKYALGEYNGIWKLFDENIQTSEGKIIRKIEKGRFLSPTLSEYSWIKEESGSTYLPIGEYNPNIIKEDIINGKYQDSEDDTAKKYINVSNLSQNANSFYVMPDTNKTKQIYDELLKKDGELSEFIKRGKISKFANISDIYDATWVDINQYDSGALCKIGRDYKDYLSIPAFNENRENFYVRNCTNINIDNKSKKYDISIFGHPLYYVQDSDYARAYLFLMFAPLLDKCPYPRTYIKNTANLKIKLLREGAYYWRQRIMGLEGNSDPIKYSDGVKPLGDKNNYFGGRIIKKNENENYTTGEEMPSGCTLARKNALMKYFLEWVENEYTTEIHSKLVLRDRETGKLIEDPNRIEWYATADAKIYKNIGEYNTAGYRVNMKLAQDSSFQKNILCPLFGEIDTTIDCCDFNETNKTNEKDFEEAFNGFLKQIKKLYKDQIASYENHTAGTDIKPSSSIKSNSDVKLAVYMTLKNLYDKWFCCRDKRLWDYKFNLEECKYSDFNNFMYLDSFYHKIGGRLFCNPNIISNTMDIYIPTAAMKKETMTDKIPNKSLYEFWANICESHQLMFLALPHIFGSKTTEDLENMFDATPWNKSSDEDTSSYLCLYTYKPSEHLDVNDDFENDGYNIVDDNGDIAFVDTQPSLSDEGYNIPAFGVTFGTQNQSIFKNIQLATNNSPQTTEHAIAATMQIAAKGSGDDQLSTPFNGQDLYRIYASNSYQCTVTMMGNAQIMPYMYFQITNIPLWKGAYLVTKVEHQINAGRMETTFTGVRINKYALNLYKGEGFLMSDNMEWKNSTKTKYTTDWETSYTGTTENDWSQIKYKPFNKIGTFLRSTTAQAKGIYNKPDTKEIENNLFRLASTIGNLFTIFDSEKGRASGFTVTSGYRNAELNKAISGATSSSHCNGTAVDIQFNSQEDLVNFAEWAFDYCEENDIRFNQILVEHTSDTRRWLHFDIMNNSGQQRGEYYADFLATAEGKGKNKITKKANWAA